MLVLCSNRLFYNICLMYYDAAVSELAWYIYLYMQSVVITTNVMISIFARAEVYSMSTLCDKECQLLLAGRYTDLVLFLQYFSFPKQYNGLPRNCWNIVKRGVKQPLSIITLMHWQWLILLQLKKEILKVISTVNQLT